MLKMKKTGQTVLFWCVCGIVEHLVFPARDYTMTQDSCQRSIHDGTLLLYVKISILKSGQASRSVSAD